MVHASGARTPGLGTWARRGCWIGLVAGLVELGLAVVPALMPKAHWPGLFHVSPHWLWLKPLAGGVLGTLVALTCALIQRAAPRLMTMRVIVWCVCGTVLLSIALPYRKSIWIGSLLLLAAGGAVPVSVWLSRRLQMLDGRRMAVVCAGIVFASGLAGATIFYLPLTRERQARASLPAAAPDTPNIVLVVLDTVRPPDLTDSPRGLDSLPNIAKLASEGVRFTQAIATSSWTLESHASLFTGRYPQHIFSGEETLLNFETPFPGGVTTLAEVLGRQGYLTGGFVANTNYTSREHGLNRGFVHYDDYPLRWSDVVPSSALGLRAIEMVRFRQGRPRPVGQRTAEEVTGAFLDWFDSRAGRPVFAFLNLFDAHDPYVPEHDFLTGPPIGNPMINPYYRYPADEVAALKRAYDDCVRYLDHIVGKLAAALEQRGALSSTVLIVTSDHGEHFGEHELMSHGNSLYRHSLQVPLVIRFPKGIPAGAVVQAPVSLVDVPATVVELAGVTDRALPGTPLSPMWLSPGAAHPRSLIISSVIVGREPHHFAPKNWPVSRGSMRSVVVGGLHYILNGDGEEELYDWAQDVGETRNLVQSGGYGSELNRFRAILAKVEEARPRR